MAYSLDADEGDKRSEILFDHQIDHDPLMLTLSLFPGNNLTVLYLCEQYSNLK
jgi:hypothetical protein